MATIDRDGVKIHYEVRGQGPVILLSHGYSATARMWDGQLQPLSRHHTVVTWDMRGHGRSDSPADAALYSAPLTIGDMAAVLDEVGAKTAIVGGLSLGGYMSLMFHAMHPERVRALLIISTGPGFRKDEAREGWNRTARERGAKFEAGGMTEVAKLNLAATGGEHTSPMGLALAARGMLTQTDAQVMESLPGIRVPSLVLVGDQDTPFLQSADVMAAKIAGARKVVLAGAGHLSNVDQPVAFNEAVTDFLGTLG